MLRGNKHCRLIVHNPSGLMLSLFLLAYSFGTHTHLRCPLIMCSNSIMMRLCTVPALSSEAAKHADRLRSEPYMPNHCYTTIHNALYVIRSVVKAQRLRR